MKKRVLSLFAMVVACMALCFGLAGCGDKIEEQEEEDKTVKQEVYTGDVHFSESKIIPVELVIDDFGTFTLVSTNGEALPIGPLGFPKDGLGGIYRKNGRNVTFETLDGEEVATATTSNSGITINYRGITIELSKNAKTVQKDKLYGAYKGYVNDGRPFELRLILRGDIWFIIEEDGDVHEFGKYKLEGNLITAYYNDEPNEICAFGTVNGDMISLNVEGEDISFQKV